MNKPTQVHAKVIARLSSDVFNKFAEKFPKLAVNERTTALQVATSLGQQQVLDALRKELTIEDD